MFLWRRQNKQHFQIRIKKMGSVSEAHRRKGLIRFQLQLIVAESEEQLRTNPTVKSLKAETTQYISTI